MSIVVQHSCWLPRVIYITSENGCRGSAKPYVIPKVHVRLRLHRLRDDIVMERFCTLVGLCVGSVLAPRGRAAAGGISEWMGNRR